MSPIVRIQSAKSSLQYPCSFVRLYRQPQRVAAGGTESARSNDENGALLALLPPPAGSTHSRSWTLEGSSPPINVAGCGSLIKSALSLRRLGWRFEPCHGAQELVCHGPN